MWEKEKLLVTGNFSFSHSVFKRLVSQRHQKASLCGNGLTSKKVEAYENIMGGGGEDDNKNFFVKIQEIHKYVICGCDMTEIMLKEVLHTF